MTVEDFLKNKFKNIIDNFFNDYLKEEDSKNGITPFDSREIYNEFSFQHELGIYLREVLKECNDYQDYKVQFERNKRIFDDRNEFQKELKQLVNDCNDQKEEKEELMLDFSMKWNVTLFENIKDNKLIDFKYMDKHEIDICIYSRTKRYAIELKYPLEKNGRTPQWIYDFGKDIKFMENLKKQCNFTGTYCIIITDNSKIYNYDGNSNNPIYDCLRESNKYIPKDIKYVTNNVEKTISLTGKYPICWKNWKNHKYLIIEC